MEWPIDMEWMGSDSISRWNRYGSLLFDLPHDLEPGFLRLNFQIAISKKWER